MSKTDGITQARLKELLHYDPETGLFTHLTSRGGINVGDVAGYLNSRGYIKIQIDGVLHSAHRLAFLYILGYMPEQVDHDNQIRHDNRWINLNPATYAINIKNHTLRCNNTSGHVGVSYHKPTGKWLARTKVDGKYIHLGLFTHKQDAIAAREAANIKYGFHVNHGSAKSCQ